MVELKPFHGLLFVLVFIQLVYVCEPLNMGDKGVCEEKVTVNASAVNNSSYGDKLSPAQRKTMRRKGRNRGLFVKQSQLVCCIGWTYQAGYCKPLCQPECRNGECVEPNKCICRPGYEEDPTNKFNCIPVCEPDCVFGTCTEPNVCTCNEGYKNKNNSTLCEPKCDRPCINGKCSEPNKCTCENGYENDLEEKFKCVPICESECNNGVCLFPNHCKCLSGYDKDPKNKFNCVPFCESVCIFSTCTSPNNCTCNEGYERTERSSICKPKCYKPCVNGVCSKPNKCTCETGYVKDPDDEFTCSPICTQPCTNGYCTAPNNCTCIDGYIKVAANHTVCYKPCKDSCRNGTCDLEGRCIKTRIPVNCNECNGTCSGDTDNCECPDKQPCYILMEVPAEVTTAKLAGFDTVVIVPAVVGLLLTVVIIVIIQRMWYRRNAYENKTVTTTMNPSGLGSVMYDTFGPSLMKPTLPKMSEDDSDSAMEETNTDILLNYERR